MLEVWPYYLGLVGAHVVIEVCIGQGPAAQVHELPRVVLLAAYPQAKLFCIVRDAGVCADAQWVQSTAPPVGSMPTGTPLRSRRSSRGYVPRPADACATSGALGAVSQHDQRIAERHAPARAGLGWSGRR